MLLLHTSDWHLGMPGENASYRDDQEYFFEQLYDIVLDPPVPGKKGERVSAVLIAGDVFDSAVTDAESVALYDRVMTKLCGELGTQVIVIAGNHDSSVRLGNCGELLKHSGLHVTGRLATGLEPVLLGDGAVAVWPLPWFTRDAVTELYPDEKDRVTDTESAFMLVCGKIREKMDPHRRNIILAHALVGGSELSESDRSAQIGGANAVSRRVFEGFGYAALGHIHKPQQVAPNVRYSGTPAQYSFGEAGQEKSVVILDTETMAAHVVPLKQKHVHREIRGSLAEIRSMAAADPALAECRLNIELTDRIADAGLRTEFEGMFPYLRTLRGIESAQAPVSGRSADAGDLDRISDAEILRFFMRDRCGEEPDQRQVSLFLNCLEAADRHEKGGA